MSDEFESCTNCIHSGDSEPICILRLCKHAIAETKDCYESKIKSSFPRCHENDCISRQDAIDAMEESKKKYFDRRGIIGKMQVIVNNLPSAQPEQRWITSGKPMNSGMYLVTLRQKFEGEEAYRVRIMRFINGNWLLPKHFPEWINEEIEQEVLAWQDLPEPWKGCEAE